MLNLLSIRATLLLERMLDSAISHFYKGVVIAVSSHTPDVRGYCPSCGVVSPCEPYLSIEGLK